MQIISMILSGLALLAASISMTMTVFEKKRSKKRNAAMIQYIDKKCEEITGRLSEANAKIRDLEQGITPDYEKAKSAANAMNDFNQGVSNLLGFDPMAAWKKIQQREKIGGDTE